VQPIQKTRWDDYSSGPSIHPSSPAVLHSGQFVFVHMQQANGLIIKETEQSHLAATRIPGGSHIIPSRQQQFPESPGQLGRACKLQPQQHAQPLSLASMLSLYLNSNERGSHQKQHVASCWRQQHWQSFHVAAGEDFVAAEGAQGAESLRRTPGNSPLNLRPLPAGHHAAAAGNCQHSCPLPTQLF